VPRFTEIDVARLAGPCLAQACLGVALAISVTAGAHGQDSTPANETPAVPAEADAATPPPPPPPPPEVVSISEVPGSADRRLQELTEIRDRVHTAEVAKGAQQLLDASTDELEDLQNRLMSMLARRHTTSELEGIGSGSRDLAARLDTAAEELRGWGNQIEQWRQEIEEREEVWIRTGDLARSESAPEAVLRQITDVLDAQTALNAQLTETRNAASDLQSRVIERRDRAQRIDEQVSTATEELAATLLVRDVPIWRTPRDSQSLTVELNRVVNSLVDAANQLVEYANRSTGNLVAHALGILLLGLGLRRARRVLLRREDDADEPPIELRALAHPWMAATVVGLVFTRFIHPERNHALVMVFMVFTLISLPLVVAVLRGLVPTRLRGVINSLVLLGSFDLFRQIIMELDRMNRFLLLAELIVIAGAFLLLRRQGRLGTLAAPSRGNPWLALLHGWYWLGLIMALAGAGAAVLGYERLAELLLKVVLWGTYVGVMWFAGVHVVQAVLESIAHSHRLAKLPVIGATTWRAAGRAGGMDLHAAGHHWRTGTDREHHGGCADPSHRCGQLQSLDRGPCRVRVRALALVATLAPDDVDPLR